MITNYINKYLSEEDSHTLFEELLNIDWLSNVKARREQFMATQEGIEYSYGNKEWAKVYTSIPLINSVKNLIDKINSDYNTNYNVVFLNRYDSNTDNINWHSDDSKEMDNLHPICVISLGQVRRILTKLKESKDYETETFLSHGSLFIMPANFQKTHNHKIPKEGFNCNTRISLTFRKYI